MQTNQQKFTSISGKEVGGRADTSPLTPNYQIGQEDNFAANIVQNNRPNNSLELFMQNEKLIQKENEKKEQEMYRLRYEQQVHDQQQREDLLKTNYRSGNHYGTN